MSKITYWLWGLAETAELADWFPRPFWSWLLRWCDRRAGYQHDAEGYIINPHVGAGGCVEHGDGYIRFSHNMPPREQK